MTARHLAAALVVFALATSPAAAQTGPYSPELLAPFKPIASKVSESTVKIQCDDKDAALGTVVFADGYILTKASELRGVVSIVLADGSAHEASVVGIHTATDLALLKLDLKKADLRQLKPVKFADSKKTPVGNWLVAPGPTSDPLAVGIVSVMTRDLSSYDKTDIASRNRGFLGITTGEPDEGKKGVKVMSFSTSSGAEEAGVKKFDIITHVNGKLVEDPDSLRLMLGNYQKGDTVNVKVVRKDEEKAAQSSVLGGCATFLVVKANLKEQAKEFKVTLGEPQKERSDIQNSWGSKLSGRRTGFPAILQTDMVVNAEKCGGPVLDLEGNVLGVCIARAGRVETWILPSETIRPLLNDLKEGKFPTEIKVSEPKKDEPKKSDK
jgi:serine protease Do